MKEQLPRGWDGSWLEASILVLLAVCTGIVAVADFLCPSRRPEGLAEKPEPKL